MIRHVGHGVLGVLIGAALGWVARPDPPSASVTPSPLAAVAPGADASTGEVERARSLPGAARHWRPTPAEDPDTRAITEAVYGPRIDFDDEAARSEAREALLNETAPVDGETHEVLHVDCAAVPCLAVLAGRLRRAAWDEPGALQILGTRSDRWIIALLPEDLPVDDPFTAARVRTLLAKAP